MTSLEKHRANITPISGLHHPLGIGSLHECEKVWLTAGGHALRDLRPARR